MIGAANAVIIAVGAVIAVMSVWGIVSPARLIGAVTGVMDSGFGMLVAVGIRVILGLSLIVAAAQAWTPRVFLAIGVASLVAAVLLPFIGQARVRRLLGWVKTLPVLAIQVWLVFGVGFGGYLVYAVVR